MSLMVEKGTKGGTHQYYSKIRHATHQYAHANNSYMKDTDKNKELSYLKYWDVNHLNRQAMSQNRTVDGFELVENTSQFSKDFIQTAMSIVMKEIFLKLMFSILETYMNFMMINLFCLKE